MIETKNKKRLLENTYRFLEWHISRVKQTEIFLKGDFEYFGVYRSPAKICLDVLSPIKGVDGNPLPPRQKIPYGDHPRSGECIAYFTLNQLSDECFAKSADHISGGKGLSFPGDKDVIEYKLFLVDFDAIRTSGVSSTRAQKHRAMGCMRRVFRYLKKRGIYTLPADSGNGGHLLVPVSYPKTTETEENLKRFLTYIKTKFESPGVDIDLTVTNPQRLCALYGALKMKGSDTLENPHSYAQVRFPCPLYPPDMLQDVDVFKILENELADPENQQTAADPDSTEAEDEDDGEGEKKGKKKKPAKKIDLKVKMREILAKEGFNFREKQNGDILWYQFEKCPLPTHEDDGHDHECAVGVAGDGRLCGSCKHDSTMGWRDFKSFLNWATYQIPFKITDEDQKKIDDENKQIIESKKVIPIGLYNTTCFFWCHDSKQFLEIAAKEIWPPMLCSDENYWIAYGGDEAYDWGKDGEPFRKEGWGMTIREKLLADCKATNRRLDHVDRCETGMYKELDGRYIYCAGNRIFENQIEKQFHEIKSDVFYQASNPVPITMIMSTNNDFEYLVYLFSQTTLENKHSAWMFASTLLSGFTSGFSPMRTHMWISSDREGTGKSEIAKYSHILTSAIDSIRRAGRITDAGIRQLIQKTRTVVILDEQEYNEDCIEKVIEFIRVCSTGDNISRGTQNGRAMTFTAKSSFVLFSVSHSLVKSVDKSRFILLKMSHNVKKELTWAELQPKMDEFITPELSAKFCWRMYCNANKFLQFHRKIKNVFIDYLKTKEGVELNNLQRAADIFATMLSTYFILGSDFDMITLTDETIIKKIDELIEDDILGYLFPKKSGESSNLSESLYDKILDHQLNVKGTVASIRQILNGDCMIRSGTENYTIQPDYLHSYGIYPLEKLNLIKFKSNHSFLTSIAKEFGYLNYREILKSIPGAQNPPSQRFIGKERVRGIELPYEFPSPGVVFNAEKINMDNVLDSI